MCTCHYQSFTTSLPCNPNDWLMTVQIGFADILTTIVVSYSAGGSYACYKAMDHLNACRSCPCIYIHLIWLLHPDHNLCPRCKVCNLHWCMVFFFPATSYSACTCTHGGRHPLLLTRWWCFSTKRYIGYLLMCTQANRHILQLALCGGGGCGFIFYVVVVIVCGDYCMCW